MYLPIGRAPWRLQCNQRVTSGFKLRDTEKTKKRGTNPRMWYFLVVLSVSENISAMDPMTRSSVPIRSQDGRKVVDCEQRILMYATEDVIVQEFWCLIRFSIAVTIIEDLSIVTEIGLNVTTFFANYCCGMICFSNVILCAIKRSLVCLRIEMMRAYI